MDKNDLRTVLQEADDAFWEVIVKRFPQATSGDLSPWATVRLREAQREAVEEWITNNVTIHQSD